MNENKEMAPVVAAAPSASQRFTNVIMREFTNSTGNVNMTPHQKNLIQGYFIGCDNALRAAEEKRLKKAAKDDKWGEAARNQLPYTWKNVNIDAQLAQRIVAYAKLGLDMTLPNNLSAQPFMNGKNNKYDLLFWEEYRGRELKTKKYSFYPIKNMRYELVFSNDEFKVGKKDAFHTQESYEFNITNPFDRGKLLGGFAYIEFDDPQRNILLIMSKADIDKHKAASPSGGKGFWENWYNEMALKTIVHKVCKQVTLDPEKIDPDFRIMQQNQRDAEEALLAEEIQQNANRETINVTPAEPEQEAIPERTQPVQKQVEMPAQAQAEPEPVPVYYSEPQHPLKTTDEPEQYDETPQELFGNEQPGF